MFAPVLRPRLRGRRPPPRPRGRRPPPRRARNSDRGPPGPDRVASATLLGGASEEDLAPIRTGWGLYPDWYFMVSPLSVLTSKHKERFVRIAQTARHAVRPSSARHQPCLAASAACSRRNHFCACRNSRSWDSVATKGVEGGKERGAWELDDHMGSASKHVSLPPKRATAVRFAGSCTNSHDTIADVPLPAGLQPVPDITGDQSREPLKLLPSQEAEQREPPTESDLRLSALSSRRH